MLGFLLSKKATKAITQAVRAVFFRARKRFLNTPVEEKGIRFGTILPQRAVEHRDDLSLRGIFNESARAEGMAPTEALYESVERGVSDLLDAHEKLAVARVLNSVQAHLHNTDLGGAQANPEKDLGKLLQDNFEKITSDVTKVIDTESNRAKNMSTLDAISKINLTLGVDDPVVWFAGPIDGHICKDCLRLYFLKDQITPRVWKSSELSAGYFKKNDTHPCVAALHPNCRHALCSVLLGYGFANGRLTYIEPGFDVYKAQRG